MLTTLELCWVTLFPCLSSHFTAPFYVWVYSCLYFNVVYVVWYLIMVYYFCDAYINQPFMQIYPADIFFP